MSALGLQELRVEFDDVDWRTVVDSAVYRRPPFDAGEKEKGFRDAVVAEAFVQLIGNSPTTPSRCRLALVSDDELLRQHVEERTKQSQNVRVLDSLGTLEGFINALVSDVPESKVAEWREKAEKFFFDKGDDACFYYRAEIRSTIKDAYSTQLADTPPGNYSRENGTWYIQTPVFEKKEQQRLHWTTQITVESEIFHPHHASGVGGLLTQSDDSSLSSLVLRGDKAGRGKTVFHVNWSVSVSPQQERFSAARVEDHEFVETTWEMTHEPRNALLDMILRNQDQSK